MIKLFLILLLTVFPPKADLTMRFTDISIAKTISLAKTMGIKIDFPYLPKEGIIGSLVIEFHGNIVVANANKFYIAGDPITKVKVYYHRKSEYWHIKLHALGGIIEIEGVIPK
jgi:hypothetical protein